MRKTIEVNPSTLILAKGELTSFRFNGAACRISCISGRLWVTASGRPEDLVLSPGEEVTFTAPGGIVVQALRTATLRLEIRSEARARPRSVSPIGRQPVKLLP
jgi:Protein of unknown function (DUF2917)